MKKAVFRKAMENGMGRCVLELDTPQGLKSFKEIVRDGCLRNVTEAAQIDESRGEFLYTLVKKFKDAASISSHSCKYGSYCLGCRATAIAKANDIFAKDPMCIHSEGVCPITELCNGENI